MVCINSVLARSATKSQLKGETCIEIQLLMEDFERGRQSCTAPRVGPGIIQTGKPILFPHRARNVVH